MQIVTTTIAMDSKGNLTIPAEARAALGIDGAMLMDLEVFDQALVLRPTEEIPEEDLWAYTPEHIAKVERALREPRDQERQLTRKDLERLVLGSDE